MKAQHSPGVWSEWRRGEESIYIMAQHPALPTMNVARVYNDAPDEKEGEANARLIAAAPDLLYACQQMMETLRAYNLTLTKGYGLAQSAIEKATITRLGEEQP